MAGPPNRLAVALLCGALHPFVLILATSGSLYLFRTEIEAWIDGGIDRSVQPGEPATASRQIEAALAALPGSTFVSYQVRPEGDGGAVRVFVATAGRKHRVCVDPVSLSILDTVPEEERLMRRLFRLHGELWMGEYGSWLVELAASWTILMILTGLILWWPRNASGLGGVVYPRFSAGRRTWLRDLHAVTGVWISVFAMLLLMSGLPWSRSWGSYLRLVRSLTGTTAGTQDWSTGRRGGGARGACGSSGARRHDRPSGRRQDRGHGRSAPARSTGTHHPAPRRSV